jgi:hypothetical protein
MIRTLIALVSALTARVTGGNPRLVELAGAAGITVGMTMWHGGHAGWITGGALGLLKAWADDVDRARDDDTRGGRGR